MSAIARAPKWGIVADSFGLEARPDVYSGGAHAMDRTMVGHLQETAALLFGELADERDRLVDLVGDVGLRSAPRSRSHAALMIASSSAVGAAPRPGAAYSVVTATSAGVMPCALANVERAMVMAYESRAHMA